MPYGVNRNGGLVNVCGEDFTILNISNRIPFRNYKKNDLYYLLYNERKLIDYWDKNMSIFTIEDWPFFKRTRFTALLCYG
ncbi:MAG: hypothetical protein ACFFB6_05910 [Promethearchaeota archaeon]